MRSLQSEPLWLPLDAVVYYNMLNIVETGENHALLFPDNLESALVRPYASWHYNNNFDTVSLGVLYMEAIARAHAFEQGNKRTAFDAGFVFMMANGFELSEDADREIIAVAFIELIEKTRTTVSFEKLIKDYVIAV